MEKFFCKFGIWRREYPRNVIAKFCDKYSNLLSAEDTNWKLEMTSDDEVILTGILPQFADQQALIIQLLEEVNQVQK